MNTLITWTHLILAVALIVPPAGAHILADEMASGCPTQSCCCSADEGATGLSMSPGEDMCPCSASAPLPTQAPQGLATPDAAPSEANLQPDAWLAPPAPTVRPTFGHIGGNRPASARSPRVTACIWTL